MTGTLPKANSPKISRSLVARDRDIILAALDIFNDQPEALIPFEAHLPETVGSVPKSERPFFDNPPCSYLFTGFGWSMPPNELEGTVEFINQDMERLGRKLGDYVMARADFMQDDQTQGIHIDSGVVHKEQADDLFYLIANRNAVLAYSGTGHLCRANRYGIETVILAPDFSPSEACCVEDYAILRCTRATVHASNPPTHNLMIKKRFLLRPIFLH